MAAREGNVGLVKSLVGKVDDIDRKDSHGVSTKNKDRSLL